MAIQYGQQTTANIILKNGGHVDIHDGKPLQMACRTKQYDMVRYLIQQKANVNIPSTFTGTTALMFAAQTGDHQICKYLLEHKANPDVNCHPRNCGYHNGWTALHYACDQGHLDLIQLFVLFGAKIDHPTVNGDTALSIAAESGQFEVVKWMVLNGANVNSKRRQMNPTQWAIFRADPVAVMFLVAFGGLPKLDQKILWFENQETLAQKIAREFDPEIQKRIDLAIYRGSKFLRARAGLISKLQQVRWTVSATYDVSSWDAKMPPQTTTFPGKVCQLISACVEELTPPDDEEQFEAPLPDIRGIPKRPKHPDKAQRDAANNRHSEL
jgi:hypothetical protein